MAYEVLARKWRPQKFDDVIGQDHVTQTLRNAIKSDRVAHAYLFVGPRGVGKTSSARILAKALNCQKGPTADPCGECDSCREIISGSSLDVIEIDAASNTGVDNVRDLRDNVRYAPARGPFKVYIIDEVHMLSIAAFNALLKTLEEPPAHVKFIFATTEPQKVPATILSRCQRFDLRRISTRDIVSRLAEIAKAEGVSIEDDAVLAIARGAEGGLRDAESALDQLIAFRGKKIVESDVLSVFGLAARHTLEDLAGSVLKGDIVSAIRLVAELDSNGKDIQRVVLELLEHFRNILICRYAGDSLASQDLTEAQAQAIQAQAEGVDPAKVLRIVDIMTETENRMRYALSRRTLLETALIRSSRAAVTVTLDDILAHIEELRRGGVGQGGCVPAGGQPASAEPARPAAAVKEDKPSRLESKAAPQSSPSDELAVLVGHWRDIEEKAGHLAPLAKAYLKDAKPIAVSASHVKVGFDPEFAEKRDEIDIPRNRKAVEKAVGDVLKRNVTVEFTVLDAKSTLPGDIKVENLEKMESKSPESRTKRKGVQEWVQNPAVKKTLEMFNGDIVDVRE